MYVYIRDPRELPLREIWVVKPKNSYDELTKGRVENVEHDCYKKDHFVVYLQVDSHTVIVHLLFLIKRVERIDHVSPFRVTRDTKRTSLMILYDSPPSSLVMSASEVAVYRVLKPVYTAICSVTE